jgi:hypothetical protein
MLTAGFTLLKCLFKYETDKKNCGSIAQPLQLQATNTNKSSLLLTGDKITGSVNVHVNSDIGKH